MKEYGGGEVGVELHSFLKPTQDEGD